MTNNKITAIEDLAALINETMASKEDIKAVKEHMTALRSEIKVGFDRIEPLLLAKQEQRLTDLEMRMKELEDALAV